MRQCRVKIRYFSRHLQLFSKKSDALESHGYTLEETPGHAIYLQKNYLKFGKTDYQAGITLPALTDVPENTKLTLSFDWAPMVGGTRKFDPVKVIVSITNGSQTVELEPIGHNFVNTVGNYSFHQSSKREATCLGYFPLLLAKTEHTHPLRAVQSTHF